MRYFIELRYNGGAYSGWQRQPNTMTVQERIETALAVLLREPTPIVGAGRTDAGVHASFYVAHFDFTPSEKNPTLDCKWLTYKLNIILPHDIAIFQIYQVSDDSHARYHAIEREYTYIIESRKNPFTRHTSWQYTLELDIAQMNLAAATLLTHSDFTTFAKMGSDNKNNICDIRHAAWIYRPEDGTLIFTIRANRFLRNMVRAIVGTLVDVGRGRYTPEQFSELIAKKDLALASTGAVAQGLFLSNVIYPDNIK